MADAAKAYQATADALVQRILDLMQKNPDVADLSDPWDLFKHGLKCDDIGPSLAQASWALGRAKRLYRQRTGGPSAGGRDGG